MRMQDRIGEGSKWRCDVREHLASVSTHWHQNYHPWSKRKLSAPPLFSHGLWATLNCRKRNNLCLKAHLVKVSSCRLNWFSQKQVLEITTLLTNHQHQLVIACISPISDVLVGITASRSSSGASPETLILSSTCVQTHYVTKSIYL